MIDIDSGALKAYRAEPKGELRGALILIHEIWGLVDHIERVADRYAAEGYLVVAPDLLSGIGLDPAAGDELQRAVASGDEAVRNAAQPLLREKLAPSRSPEFAQWAVAALRKVVDYVDAQPGVDGRIGVLGFCFGGSYSFALAAADRRIRGAVPFYGSPPATAELAAIDCPVLAFYGDQDERLMATLPEVTHNMHDAGVQFLTHTYEGAGHAFFNDSNERMYRADAAADAWTRSIEFLRGTLAPTTEHDRP